MRLIQQLLLKLYEALRRTGLFSTPWGRAGFEFCYFWYKTLFEAGQVSLLKRYVPPGQWVIDFGANTGYFTRLFAQWVADGGKVVALEPEAMNFRRLERSIDRAGV
jgi:hypothetical protein